MDKFWAQVSTGTKTKWKKNNSVYEGLLNFCWCVEGVLVPGFLHGASESEIVNLRSGIPPFFGEARKYSSARVGGWEMGEKERVLFSPLSRMLTPALLHFRTPKKERMIAGYEIVRFLNVFCFVSVFK